MMTDITAKICFVFHLSNICSNLPYMTHKSVFLNLREGGGGGGGGATHPTPHSDWGGGGGGYLSKYSDVPTIYKLNDLHL